MDFAAFYQRGVSYEAGTLVTFVEIGVFQGRLWFHVLSMCPFVKYIGVDPYAFANEDYEFQGLFTDHYAEKQTKEDFRKGMEE